MKKVLIAAAVALALGGCASNGGPSFSEVVAQAEAEMKVAKGMDYLWRNTGKILKKAKAAEKKNDHKKAMKLAKKALKQAKDAQQQAKDNANPKVYYN
ncbi:MAG: hypothetical protein BMS9Abin36_1095 [Gammaproteobacteria bacterium]|nr:MAG: hypothetical protein BMS9Abin36_1095 [Gammaproteobacteria bacterium]